MEGGKSQVVYIMCVCAHARARACVCASNAESANSHFWCLRFVLAIKELGQCTLLNRVNAFIVEPGGVAGDDNVVLLSTHVVFLRESFWGGLEGRGSTNTTLPLLLGGGRGLQFLIGVSSGGGGSRLTLTHLTFGRSIRRPLSSVVTLCLHLIIRDLYFFWFTDLHYITAWLYGWVVNGNSFHVGLRRRRSRQAFPDRRRKTFTSIVLQQTWHKMFGVATTKQVVCTESDTMLL